MSKHPFAGLLCAGLLSLVALSPALAADISTYTVGSLKIVRIVDGKNGVPVAQLRGGDSGAVRQLVDGDMCPNLITSYVLDNGEGLTLLDSGFGDIEPGAMYGHFLAAGYKPGDVKRVLLTHLHGDHIGGLIKGDRKVFPNALIYVNEAELAFWKDRGNWQAVPEMMRYCFDAVAKLLHLYGDQVKTFREGERVVPWLSPINVAGHTAGHTMFELNYEGETVYLWGDIIHCLAVQARYPDVSVPMVDTDPEQASRARRRALELVANTDRLVFGEHFTNPGVGKFRSRPDGGYDFVAIEADAE